MSVMADLKILGVGGRARVILCCVFMFFVVSWGGNAMPNKIELPLSTNWQ